MPLVVSILCPWCAWAAAIAGSDDLPLHDRAREVVLEHVALVHPERRADVERSFESWLSSDD